MNEDEPVEFPEDLEFLNMIDKGYIGYSRPQIVIAPFEREEQPDQDNWAGSPEQAWA